MACYNCGADAGTNTREVNRRPIYKQEDILDSEGKKIGTRSIIDHIDVTRQDYCARCGVDHFSSYTVSE